MCICPWCSLSFQRRFELKLGSHLRVCPWEWECCIACKSEWSPAAAPTEVTQDKSPPCSLLPQVGAAASSSTSPSPPPSLLSRSLMFLHTDFQNNHFLVVLITWAIFARLQGQPILYCPAIMVRYVTLTAYCPKFVLNGETMLKQSCSRHVGLICLKRRSWVSSVVPSRLLGLILNRIDGSLLWDLAQCEGERQLETTGRIWNSWVAKEVGPWARLAWLIWKWMSGINLNTSHILLNTSVFLLLPPASVKRRTPLYN